jgi:V8-like Glu-specific endopeptidase
MSMKKNPKLSLQDVENFADFKINDVEKYPNNLTCYLKMKIFDALGVKGTGCLIGPTYLLTSAHNVTGIDNFKQTKPN